MGHRGAGVPDGGDDPALVQHAACGDGEPALDMGGDRAVVPGDHVAVDGALAAGGSG